MDYRSNAKLSSEKPMRVLYESSQLAHHFGTLNPNTFTTLELYKLYRFSLVGGSPDFPTRRFDTRV